MRPLTTAALAVALAAGSLTALAPSASHAQFAVSVRVGYPPPPLPEYDQPPCPGYGYIWTPGYWAWSDWEDDYYWVPGAWVLPPETGYLWTPGYWAFNDGIYVFTPGYWGLTIGFYGGINYGYGYNGFGYDGGYWRGRDFFYNRRLNNLGRGRFDHIYDRQPYERGDRGGASFNGGWNGVRARPTPDQLAGFRQRRLEPTRDQLRQFDMARREPSLRAGENHGAPPIAATQRPGEFRGPGVTRAPGAPDAYRRDGFGSRQGPVDGQPPNRFDGQARAAPFAGAPQPPARFQGDPGARDPGTYRPSPPVYGQPPRGPSQDLGAPMRDRGDRGRFGADAPPMNAPAYRQSDPGVSGRSDRPGPPAFRQMDRAGGGFNAPARVAPPMASPPQTQPSFTARPAPPPPVQAQPRSEPRQERDGPPGRGDPRDRGDRP